MLFEHTFQRNEKDENIAKCNFEERPIIFSDESVQSILRGTKTQTRRVVKPQPHDMSIPYIHHCPYGCAGDRLWVRETWDGVRLEDGSTIVSYRASGDQPVTDNNIWKSSEYMPKWASRILLEITDVRTERVQYISEADAMAEGVERPVLSATEIEGSSVHPMTGMYRDGFKKYWNALNLNYSWGKNPWVFVIEFVKLENVV